MQVSGFHSGVPVLPLANYGTPGKLFDPSVACFLCKMGIKVLPRRVVWDLNKHILTKFKWYLALCTRNIVNMILVWCGAMLSI